MNSPFPAAFESPERPVSSSREVSVQQYSLAQVLAVWALATVPMGLVAWILAPALAHVWRDEAAFARALLISLTLGLIWQAAVVVACVYREQGSLRWAVLRRALWLETPFDPRSGEQSRRMWWMLLPWCLILLATQAVPQLPGPVDRNFSAFLQSGAGMAFFRGNWAWFLLVVVMLVFNTVLGEELLFRGLLLPRMQEAFGKGAWLGNAALFTLYHVHQPWTMPTVILPAAVFSYSTQRYRSAWFGIVLHSLQSVLVTALLLMVVLK